jgi:hypothetical protein
MAFSLGSKKPKKEVELSQTMSWILVIGWCILMGVIIMFLVNRYAMGDVNRYVVCSTGEHIEWEDNRSVYCGMTFESFDQVRGYITNETIKMENDPFYNSNLDLDYINNITFGDLS